MGGVTLFFMRLSSPFFETISKMDEAYLRSPEKVMPWVCFDMDQITSTSLNVLTVIVFRHRGIRVLEYDFIEE
jgi:hypothetical protein